MSLEHDGEFWGHTSEVLEKMKGDGSRTLMVSVEKSHFDLPREQPVIMIGPGTGVAPFIAFCEEREKLALKSEAHLYFGCRKSDSDYIYRDQLRAWKDSGVLTTLREAFSRESQDKVYVQNLLEEDAEKVLALVESGAYVFVCGSTAMGHDVLKFFESRLGKERVQELEKEARLVKELW